jgi:hypothetical protein
MTKLSEQFRNASSDRERWKIVIDNPDKITIVLDNDMTMINFNLEKDEHGDTEYSTFSDFIGDSSGLFDLFDVLGIPCEGV